MENLSLILWRERELLETLLFKLEVEQLVLAAGRQRWLARAAREVETVLDALREAEVLRAVAADEVASSLGLSHNPPLSGLAASVDEPWRTILIEHRDAFVRVTQEVDELASTNRSLLAAGQHAVHATVQAVLGPDDGQGNRDRQSMPDRRDVVSIHTARGARAR